MRAVLGGIGLTFSRFFFGSEQSQDQHPVEWMWCLGIAYRTPYTRFGWKNWRCWRYIYFGKPRHDHVPGYWEHVYNTRLLIKQYGW